MMNRSRRHDPLRCPRCGSRYTQSLSLAYNQAKRTDPRATLSEFAASVAPPNRRSTVLMPLAGWFWVSFLLYILVHVWGLETRQTWAFADKPFIPWLLVTSLATGAIVAFVWRSVAMHYNSRRWCPEHEIWERTAVCRRCNHRFVPKVDLSSQEDNQ